jgi:hypothetical protein
MEALLGEWLNNMAGPQYASAVMWTVGALVLLVIVIFLVRLIRGVSSGTFVAGGRNRRARLAVMDAAAIDNQRRLVLVRRDNVEHLILIGGPTDVVVEQNIVPGTTGDAVPVRTGSDLPNGRDTRPATPQPQAKVRQEPVAAAEPAIVATSASRAPEPPPVKAERAEPVLSTEPEMALSTPISVPRDADASPAPTGSVHFLDKARIGAAPQTEDLLPPAAAASVLMTRASEARRMEISPEISAPEREAPYPEAARIGTDTRIEPIRHEPRANLDAALRKELKEPLVSELEAQSISEPSLEDEMKRLLGELSAPARG